MERTVIDQLINPYNKQRLSLTKHFGEFYLADRDGNRIPFRDGIPDFLVLEQTAGLNEKYRKFYDRVSRLNKVAEFLNALFYDLEKVRTEWMEDVEIKPGYRVLETSIGTGWNFRVLPKLATYYGVDISHGMLKQAKKNRERWDLDIRLFQGNAEYLPFADGIFDSVFHVGGINFFNDRQRAISEMIRVAKPGTKIVIIDETSKTVRKQYKRMPVIKKYSIERNSSLLLASAPVDLVPGDVTDLRVKSLDHGKMYQLSFRKAC